MVTINKNVEIAIIIATNDGGLHRLNVTHPSDKAYILNCETNPLYAKGGTIYVLKEFIADNVIQEKDAWIGAATNWNDELIGKFQPVVIGAEISLEGATQKIYWGD